MIKTIFYKKTDTDNPDYYLDGKPYNEWFTLDDFLYEPNGNIIKENINSETRVIKNVIFYIVEDNFSKDGIIRRIATSID